MKSCALALFFMMHVSHLYNPQESSVLKQYKSRCIDYGGIYTCLLYLQYNSYLDRSCGARARAGCDKYTHNLVRKPMAIEDLTMTHAVSFWPIT